jgi:hypothetical protein
VVRYVSEPGREPGRKPGFIDCEIHVPLVLFTCCVSVEIMRATKTDEF